MFQKLRTVVYHVKDLEKAKEWYSKLIGFAPYFEAPYYVGFDIQGSELGLDPDFTGITEGNLSFVFWSVTGIEDCLARCMANGATLQQDIQDVGGGIKTAVVNDPWGNAIGLIEEGTV